MLIIIKILLNLNKFIYKFNRNRFTFIKYCFNKRLVFIKLSTCSNTSNPLIKTYIRLCVVNCSVSIISHHTTSFCFSRISFHTRRFKSIYKHLSSRTIFYTFLIITYLSFFACTNRISYSNSCKSIFKFKLTFTYNFTCRIFNFKFYKIKTTINMLLISYKRCFIINNTIRHTRTLCFFSTLKKILTTFVKFSISFK